IGPKRLSQKLSPPRERESNPVTTAATAWPLSGQRREQRALRCLRTAGGPRRGALVRPVPCSLSGRPAIWQTVAGKSPFCVDIGIHLGPLQGPRTDWAPARSAGPLTPSGGCVRPGRTAAWRDVRAPPLPPTASRILPTQNLTNLSRTALRFSAFRGSLSKAVK